MNPLYPIFLKIENKHCLVVGGGEVARRKIQALVDSGAAVTVIAPKVCERIHRWAIEGRIALLQREYQRGDVNGFFLVIAATDSLEINRAVSEDAEKRNILVNIVDTPELCSFYLGSVLQRGDLKIAVSTNGKSPALARKIRLRLEKQFGAEYERLLNWLGAVRRHIKDSVPDSAERENILKKVVYSNPIEELAREMDYTFERDSRALLTSRRCSPSKVYLVGAGPGDAGLITVKGLKRLRQADVIIYDHLINRELLAYARPDAELIPVGKRASEHRLSQQQINALLVRKAQEGKAVVRLKGGDPFVFGRGGEEAEALAEAGIRFEVVPGVTAGVAVPAYAGIPVTHRDFASTCTLITGHQRADLSPTGDGHDGKSTHGGVIPWDVIAKSGGTLAFYMGVKNLPKIVEKLIEHGRSSDTPAAIISNGTLPTQEIIVGTLEDIVGKAQKATIQPPALIIVGEVVTLHRKLNWFEKRSSFDSEAPNFASPSPSGTGEGIELSWIRKPKPSPPSARRKGWPTSSSLALLLGTLSWSRILPTPFTFIRSSSREEASRVSPSAVKKILFTTGDPWSEEVGGGILQPLEELPRLRDVSAYSDRRNGGTEQAWGLGAGCGADVSAPTGHSR